MANIMRWVTFGMPPLVRDRNSSPAARLLTPCVRTSTPQMRCDRNGYRVTSALRDLDTLLVMIFNSIDPRELPDFKAAVLPPLGASTTLSHLISPVGCSGSQSSSWDSVKSVTPSGFALNIASHLAAPVTTKSANMAHTTLHEVIGLRGRTVQPFDYADEHTRPIKSKPSRSPEDTLSSLYTRKQLCNLQISDEPPCFNEFETEPRVFNRKRKRFSVKHYSDAAPSTHCHVCCRSSKNVKVKACGRIQVGTCRKVICERCLEDYPYLAQARDGEYWICSHCRGDCPERGQCYTYGRSNMRRRELSMRRQVENAKEAILSTLQSKQNNS